MGFKFNVQPKQNNKKLQQGQGAVSGCARRRERIGGEAVEIMETFSERIEDLSCRDDVKILLKKCLFRMVAAESVESEISFLSEMRMVLETPSSEEELFQSHEMKELSCLVREMYEIAIDKSIDQDYHKSSRYIDHLNVLDDRFRYYALSSVSVYPSEIMRQINNHEINLFNREEFEEALGDHNQDERRNGDNEEEDKNQNDQQEEHINLPDRSSEYFNEYDSENEEDPHEILPYSYYRQYEELDQIQNIQEDYVIVAHNGQQEIGDTQQEEEKELEQKNDNVLEKDTIEQLISRRASWFTREVSSNIQWPSDLELHRYSAQEEEDNSNLLN